MYNQNPEQGIKLLGLLLTGSTGQHMASRNGKAFSIEAEEEQNRIDHIPEYVTDITCCRDLPFHFRFEFPLATAIRVLRNERAGGGVPRLTRQVRGRRCNFSG